MGNIDWIKGGNIFSSHKAQLPVPFLLENGNIRIFYSTRISGKSVPRWIDVSYQDPSIIKDRSQGGILSLGKPGSFDWSGVMPTCVIKSGDLYYMYYIGWSQRLDVPYHNNLGLATSKDLTKWEKYSNGPVLSTCSREPGYIGTCDIIKNGDIYLMYYLSCREWIEHNGRMEPIYDIKIAESNDLINWEPLGKTAIELENDEGGISSSRVINVNGKYYMYFSVRDRIDYRENSSKAYRIKKAVSSDLLNWERIDGIELDVSEDKWEDFMVCYPGIIKKDEALTMFYNGNGFGDTGIGYARKN